MLLQGNSWGLRFDGLSLRFWQTSTRVHQILIPTHNHKVTPYSFCLKCLQPIRADIMTQVKWAVNLVIADGHVNQVSLSI